MQRIHLTSILGRSLFLLLYSMRGLTAPEPTGLGDTSETLHDALVAAYRASAQIAAQRAHVRQTVAEKLGQARSHWLPALSLSGESGVKQEKYDYTDLFMSNSRGTVHPDEVTVSLDQPVFRGGRTVAETRDANSMITAENARLDGIEQAVLSKAAKTYFDIVTDEAVMRLRAQDVEELRRIQEEVQLQSAAGRVTQTDILQARARLGGSMVELRTAAQRLDASRVAYEQVVGHAPLFLSRPARIVELPATLAAALAAAAALNPDLKAATYNANAAAHRVSELRGQLLPSVDLQVTYRISDHPYLATLFSVSPAKQVDTTAVLSVSLPLFHGDLYAQLSGSKHALKVATLKAEDVDIDVTSSVKSAWVALQSARDRIKALEDVIDAYRASLSGVQAEQLAGSRTTIDVLNAERDFLTAQLTLATAQHDSDFAEIDLATAIGLLSGPHLGIEPSTDR